jgi:hypothetical protein
MIVVARRIRRQRLQAFDRVVRAAEAEQRVRFEGVGEAGARIAWRMPRARRSASPARPALISACAAASA